MNVQRTGLVFSVSALLLAAAVCRAGVPAGLGGFEWKTTTPQSNALHGVVAPIPGSGGVGFAATGDASTFLFRRAPFGVGASGWVGGRGRSIQTEVQYRGVAAVRSPSRVAVAASDGTVLVGDGSVFATAPLSQHGLNAVAWSVSAVGRRLSIVGDSGAAFFYDDTSRKFTPAVVQQPVGGPADLFALSFPNQGSVGYAAGDVPGAAGPQGALFRTVDGGATWSFLEMPVSVGAWLDVSFISPDTGFALGSGNGAGIVMVTQNGGLSWQPVATVDGSMRAIAAFDLQHIVLVGGNGIFTASDGAKFAGRSEPVSGLVTPLPLEDVDVAGNEAWAVGEGGVIFASYDKGDTWSVFGDVPTLSRASLDTVSALRYLSDTQVVAAGGNGSILRSLDAGGTFIVSPSASADTLYALAVPGARNAGTTAVSTGPVLAVGARRTMALLDQAAGTATLTGNVPLVDYYGVAAFPGSSGVSIWAVGQGGAIVASPNDSPMWTRQASLVTQDLHAVQSLALVPAGFNVLACGNGGTVLRSLDGTHWGPAASGGSITPLPAPFTLTNLYGIAFRTSAAGVVVGEGGVAARTVDGGRTWAVQLPTQGTALRAVSALPSSSTAPEVWAVGDHQAVLHSFDGGQTWNLLPPPVQGNPGTPPPDIAFRSVQAVGPGAAFIAGDEGHLLQTDTGGSLWTEVGATVADTYYALRMSTPLVGVAALSTLFSGPSVTLTGDAWRTTITGTLPVTQGPIYGVDMLNGEAIAVGAGGFLARTFNAASTVSPDFVSESSDIRAAVSPVAGQYVAVGDGGLVMRSADNGTTWQRVPFANPFGPDCHLRAVAFGVPDTTGNSTGYAAGGVPGGGVPVLLRTTDSGLTWAVANVGFGASGATINALAAFSNRVLAGAANGAVYSFDGVSWSVQRPIPGFAGAWNALSATDGRWYIAGEQGMAARYPDAAGNLAWGALNTGTAIELTSLAAPPYPSGSGFFGSGGIESLRDDIRGAGGNWGAILETESGGQMNWGSVTRNLPISAADVIEVLKVWAGIIMPTLHDYFYGDVWPPAPTPDDLPGDGILDFNDAAQILRMVYGL